MTQELIIRVPGTPVAQPRTKAAQVGGFIRVYTPGGANKWKDTIAHFAQSAAKSNGWQIPDRAIPLCIDMDFHMPRGSARKREVWKVKKPDKDNLEKAALDALVWSGVIACDQQAVDGRVRKPINDEWQGVVIRITMAESPDLPLGYKSRPMPTAQEAMAI